MQLLTKIEVAELLKLSTRTIEDMVSKRKIPFTKIGKLVRFKETDINKWIEKRSIKTA